MFRERPRKGRHTLGILPPYDPDTRKSSLRRAQFPKRVSRLLISVLVSLTFLGLYSLLEFDDDSWIPVNPLSGSRLPPLYRKYRLRELALPQHNLDLPHPEGKSGKYIWISGHVRGMSHDNQTTRPLIPAFLQNLDGPTSCKNTSLMPCLHIIHEEREFHPFSPLRAQFHTFYQFRLRQLYLESRWFSLFKVRQQYHSFQDPYDRANSG